MRTLLFVAMATIYGLTGVAQVNVFDTAGAVQVSREPRHHFVFGNDWVRILDVHIPPGDTTLMHIHSTPSVFMVLSHTKTGSQVLVEPQKAVLVNGNIWFEGFYDKPRIHRVWNEDTVEFHVVDMELPHVPDGSFDTASTVPFSTLLFDAKSVRAFKVRLPAGKSFKVRGYRSPVVVIGLSGPGATGVVNGKAFNGKGDYLFVPAGESLGISNGKGRKTNELISEDGGKQLSDGNGAVEFGVYLLK